MRCTPGAMRCTRNGGSTRETSIESKTRTMLEAEPCTTFRLCDMDGGAPLVGWSVAAVSEVSLQSLAGVSLVSLSS